jgi:hypothetical protein
VTLVRVLECRAGGLDRYAGQGAALLVRDAADDVAGSLCEGEGSGEGEKEEWNRGRESAHGTPSKYLPRRVAQRPAANGAAQLW